MAGRPRVPTKTLELRGTLRKDRRPRKEPQAAARAPIRPGWLIGAAGEEWERVTKELRDMGLLMSADRAMLVAYCQAWGQFEEASLELKKMKSVVIETSTGTLVQHPLVNVVNRAVERMLKIVTQFGLTPAARSRIETGSPEAADPLEEFIDGSREQQAEIAGKIGGGHEEVDADAG